MPEVKEDNLEDDGASPFTDLWEVATPPNVLEDHADDDGVDDLSVVGDEMCHVMTEVLNDVLSTESSSKVNPMVTHESHEIYKASLDWVNMEGVNYMDGSDIEETIFNPGEMTMEEWEELNDHRWYRESPVYSPVLNAGGLNNVNQSILENWQCAARNLRGEMDIGGKTLHEVEEAARRIRFGECTQRQKKRVSVKGGCGEKDRYDAAQMVRFTHANSDGDDLDEEHIEGDEEDCDDDPKKVGRKTPSRGTQCEWRVRCQYNKKSDEYKITTLNLTHTCPGHLHKWRGPPSKAPWLAQVFGDRITSEYRRPVAQF
ncbi:hypothetical protein R1sor_005496 [Riccia sorocarpa]|uniref:Uncharacterized protein n=1 Tax=Riccia sorocarpa TaxID=122646 RepID=A0ABD3HJQ0_9MARC